MVAKHHITSHCTVQLHLTPHQQAPWHCSHDQSPVHTQKAATSMHGQQPASQPSPTHSGHNQRPNMPNQLHQGKQGKQEGRLWPAQQPLNQACLDAAAIKPTSQLAVLPTLHASISPHMHTNTHEAQHKAPSTTATTTVPWCTIMLNKHHCGCFADKQTDRVVQSEA